MRPRLKSVCLLLMAGSIGCGRSSAKLANQREMAGEAFGSAVAAFQNKDFAAAAEQFTAAIEARGLNPDQYGEAFLKRAVANAALGNFDAANADLDKLVRGAPNMDEVYAARAFVLLKQGKRGEAQAMFRKARQLNSQVRMFRE